MLVYYKCGSIRKYSNFYPIFLKLNFNLSPSFIKIHLFSNSVVFLTLWLSDGVKYTRLGTIYIYRATGLQGYS